MALIISLDFTSLRSDIKCVLGKTNTDSVLIMHQKHWKGLLKHRSLDPIPRVSDSADLGWTQEFAVLTSSLVLLLLLLLLICQQLLDIQWSWSNSTSVCVHMGDYVDGGNAFASF